MNRSFSKIRHIQEVNKRLEEKLLNEQQADRQYREYAGGPVIYVFDNKKFTFDPTKGYIPYLTPEDKAGWTDEKKKLYACVYNNSSKSKISQSGGFTINGVVYYSNGRYYYPSIGTGSYSCDGDKIVRKNIDKVEGQSQQTPGSTAVPAAGEVPAAGAEQPSGLQTAKPKIVQELETGALTIKGDPYQYKVGTDNEWYAKSYKEAKKILNNWVSLKGNKTATDYLDSVFKNKRNTSSVITNQATDNVDPDQQK